MLALGCGALSNSRLLFAQQARVPRIGFLGAESAAGYATRIDALRNGLREYGYLEGSTIFIEYRWAEGRYERLPQLAADLVGRNVDVVVTHAVVGTRAIKQATATIPIVAAAVADPVAAGLVSSLARPGGNITGSTFFYAEFTAKRIEVLKEAFPRLARLGILLNPDNPSINAILKAMESTAKPMKVALQRFEVRESHELQSAFAAMVRRSIDALAVIDDPVYYANAGRIAQLAAKQRLPSIGFAELAEAGGFIGYGVNNLELWRRAGYYVHKILTGTKPADLPIEQPAKFELVLNLKSSSMLGITMPQSLVVRADKVIQ